MVGDRFRLGSYTPPPPRPVQKKREKTWIVIVVLEVQFFRSFMVSRTPKPAQVLESVHVVGVSENPGALIQGSSWCGSLFGLESMLGVPSISNSQKKLFPKP